MKKIIIILLLIVSNIYSQTLPVTRRVNWSLAGNNENITAPATVINFATQGGNNSGTVANDALMTTILNSIDANGAVIYFPNGTYLFNQNIVLKSNVILQGESSNSTILTFNLGGTGNLITIAGSISTIETTVLTDNLKEATTITVADASSFNTGDYIKIQDIDTAKIFSSWALNSTGQIIKIAAITGNQIQLSSPLRRDYLLVDVPKITKINPIKKVSLEKLTINRQDSSVGQTTNINIDYAVNCKLNCIQSLNCNFAHVAINSSSNIVVEGSYFKDAFAYGGGGQGYGVALQQSSGECLIYNNIFRHLRHCMLVQSGANGNVLSYNYAREAYWVEGLFPTNSAGDIVFHGNYPYCNLVEGNICQHIVIDNSHGINGPYNTIFRNRAELYGLFMNNSPASNSQNFISNEITNTGFLMGNYTIEGTDHFQYNNNVKGTITPAGTTLATGNSLYLNAPPIYYATNSFYPPVGIVANYNTYANEAKNRYNASTYTRCSTNETLPVVAFEKANEIILYPNPAQNYLTIAGLKENESILIYDVLGKQYEKTLISNKINIEDLQTGVYFLKINSTESNKVLKFVKH